MALSIKSFYIVKFYIFRSIFGDFFLPKRLAALQNETRASCHAFLRERPRSKNKLSRKFDILSANKGSEEYTSAKTKRVAMKEKNERKKLKS
jgi:hypothetical protein